MKIVIIEDEKILARDLEKIIKNVDPEFEVIALLHTIEDAINYLNSNKDIDLIFSDIQLGEGLSFEIFEKVILQIPVIFCTAYNQYAIEAFKATGIDYLLKPATNETVGKALDKFLMLKGKPESSKESVSNVLNELKKQLNPSKYPTIIIHQGEKIIPMDSSTVAFFYIENDNVYSYSFDQKKTLLTQTLDGLEKSCSHYFFRCNRQFLVNRKAIKDASHSFNRKVVVNLTIPFNEQIVVGKLKITSLIEWLAN